MVGVAGANIATATWLQLSRAAVGLHSALIRYNTLERYCVRTNLVKYITQSEQRCRDMLRFSCNAFEKLVAILKSKGRVKHFSRGTIEEQLVTFLLILGHNFKNRVVSVLFCRSGETISRYFHNILEAVILLEEDFVKPSNVDEVQPSILNSQRFFPSFKDCLGAIDGTHVRVNVSPLNAPRYRGRKDWPTQNVLAACTFDLKFTYILAGWEGLAVDSRVLQSAMTRDEPFVIPEGKFYLGDAGFGLSSKILTPFGRTRYHLKEYSHRPPETVEELFNHRHSSLRNAIERAFGVLKKRFSIIASGFECHFSSSTMTDVVLACVVLHNFILYEDEIGDGYMPQEEVQTEAELLTAEHKELSVNNSGFDSGEEYVMGQSLRRRIASAMWASYCVNREGSTIS